MYWWRTIFTQRGITEQTQKGAHSGFFNLQKQKDQAKLPTVDLQLKFSPFLSLLDLFLPAHLVPSLADLLCSAHLQIFLTDQIYSNLNLCIQRSLQMPKRNHPIFSPVIITMIIRKLKLLLGQQHFSFSSQSLSTFLRTFNPFRGFTPFLGKYMCPMLSFFVNINSVLSTELPIKGWVKYFPVSCATQILWGWVQNFSPLADLNTPRSVVCNTALLRFAQ